ncbi:LOW QUALITY PROTEIN: polyamine-transporting ATPase 13A3-like [Dermacentor silvarum]|uniref:LOW QUALITY PROTEIN: polyamine-transporting ATPase 13A3-like n=1 Tax=Dermacentor silvarum TaxID=543639 RepID=UPI0021007328|nr:LOW QUALITY PROTEIN: polyamine-transporting ATPase 13A3-like [Dermacentor silvarum]
MVTSTYKLQHESIALEMKTKEELGAKKPQQKQTTSTPGSVWKKQTTKKKKAAKQVKCRKQGPPPMKDGVDYVNAAEEDQMEVFGYRPDGCRTLATWCGMLLTAGLLRLLFHWHPAWWLYCTHRRCPLQQATTVLLVDQYKQVFVEKVRTILPSGVNVPLMLSVTGQADSSLLQESNKLDELVMLKPGGTLQPAESLVYFENKKIRYIWDDELKAFARLRGFDKNVPCSYFHQQKGLSLQEQVVRRVLFGDNVINVQIQSVFRILFQEVLEPFYVFQVVSIIIWFCDDYYYYASCIIVMSSLSLVTGVYQIRLSQKALSDTVHAMDVVTVKRSKGVYENIPSEQLVPGDVLIVPRNGCVMQCDAVLTAGNCIVNESMLTGESVPVVKTPLPNPGASQPALDVMYHPKEHSRHTLFCGTRVIQTRYYGTENVEAVVVRSGFLTAKGELVRSIMFPKPVDFKFNRHIKNFLLFLASLASIGVIYTIALKTVRGVPASNIIVRSLDVVTIVIPPALPAAMTIGIVFAQSRLRRALIYCISPRSINISGCINCFCFDKTGTLTEEGLDLWGVVPASGGRFQEQVPDPRKLPLDSLLLQGMATCHSITVIDRQLSGDPLDLKMFEATSWVLEEPDIDDNSKYDIIAPTVVRPGPANSFKTPSVPSLNATGDLTEVPSFFEVGIVRELPFSSGLQRMSVVTRVLGSTHFDIFCKGAPETIASLSKAETVPPDFVETLTSYTQLGHRVLALAHRPLTSSFAKVHRLPREEVENNLTFVGLLVMENRLKPETTSVIRTLRAANIRTIMVTGDNMLTAVSVARDCDMIERGQEVQILSSSTDTSDMVPVLSWQSSEAPPPAKSHRKGSELLPNGVTSISMGHPLVAVTGKTFAVLREHYPDVLQRVAVCGAVFARMAPDQKQQLVELLQEMGYYVGMCGDGANDCGALKAAHAGISLSDTEASVASPFTSKVANISCVPTLIKEGRAALVTSFGILKYMACYSMTQFTSVLILYSLYSNLTDLEFLYIDLFLITLFAALFGRTEPSPTLDKRPPPSSLMGVTPLTSILSQITLVILAQVFGMVALWKQHWYHPHEQVLGADVQEELACHDNYTVFAVSVFQYITLAVVFSRGHPYRKTILSNYLFISALVVMTAFSMYLVLYPTEILIAGFEFDMTDIDMKFRMLCVTIAVGHFIIAYVLEDYFVQGFVFKQLQLRFFSGLAPYKELQEELKDQSPWTPLSRESSIMSGGPRRSGDCILQPSALQLASPQEDTSVDSAIVVDAFGNEGPAADRQGGNGTAPPCVTHM